MANQSQQTESLPEVPIQRQKQIPIETLVELKLKNLSHNQIAKIAGCTHQNVTTRLKDYPIETVDFYKKNRADILAVIQSKIINSLSPKDIEKATAYQKVGMFALLYDKERLERGESTENIHVLTQAISDLQARKWARVEPKKLGRPKKAANTGGTE